MNLNKLIKVNAILQLVCLVCCVLGTITSISNSPIGTLLGILIYSCYFIYNYQVLKSLRQSLENNMINEEIETHLRKYFFAQNAIMIGLLCMGGLSLVLLTLLT